MADHHICTTCKARIEIGAPYSVRLDIATAYGKASLILCGVCTSRLSEALSCTFPADALQWFAAGDSPKVNPAAVQLVDKLIESGMRATRCDTCGCPLLTRSDTDRCPPCRKKALDGSPPN
jgi:hypothetical protein